MANAIDVNRLCKKLDTFTLNDISFTVPQGAIVGLVGENGADKTTTIKLLMDVMKKDSGDVTFFSDQKKVNSTDLKEDIAIVYDDINFYDKLNAVKIDKIIMNKDDLLYGYGIVRCSKQQFELIPKGLIFAYLQHEAIYHVIINDAHGFKEAYPEIVVDKVALDELLAIYIRREKNTA
ncbi:ATP-binding cassette domain-containing protein [Siminovitchia sp. FSL H7-0308]|uniref:ATP-binding cassette domain-containing protein n=1 Tax=Siminovitchia sp. FSL H7-0308 TaxID=2921432 RepID=UPI0030ED464C